MRAATGPNHFTQVLEQSTWLTAPACGQLRWELLVLQQRLAVEEAVAMAEVEVEENSGLT